LHYTIIVYKNSPYFTTLITEIFFSPLPRIYAWVNENCRNNPELRDRLEAICADAQRQIDMLMGQLGDLAEMALADPSNEELQHRIANVLGEAQAISAKLVAACGEDLLIESNRLLGAQLAGK
jgi:hypothetical protein